MKKLIFLSAIISIGFFSCKKEQITSTSKGSFKSDKATNEKALHCVPWRDVADATAAAADLNALVTCNTSTCSNGVETSMTLVNKVIANSAGTAPYYFSFLSGGVDIATQNYLWSNALSQAIALTPTGYTLSSIYNFRAVVVSQSGFNNIVIKFDIYYIKCASGGGGHN